MNILKKYDYKGLSVHLVEWREEGRLPIDCVADKTRRIIDIDHYLHKGRRILADFDEGLQSWNDLVTPKEHVVNGIDYLYDAPNDLYNYIPRWLNQSNYVEVFVEKNAMGSSFKSILDNGDPASEYKDTPRHVIVVPNGGWASYTFVMNNLSRLIHQKKMGKEVYVQYYGDSDPSGERMTAEDSKLVTKLNAYGINFERIAITEDIIQDFELEDIKNKELDAETLKKLENNPNYNWFTKRHHGQIWQIELDALLLDLPKFKELVLSNVDKHFDSSIQLEAIEQFKEKYPISSIHQELKKAVKEFNKLINSKTYLRDIDSN